MPDVAGPLVERDPRLAAGVVEQAEVDALARSRRTARSRCPRRPTSRRAGAGQPGQGRAGRSPEQFWCPLRRCARRAAGARQQSLGEEAARRATTTACPRPLALEHRVYDQGVAEQLGELLRLGHQPAVPARGRPRPGSCPTTLPARRARPAGRRRPRRRGRAPRATSAAACPASDAVSASRAVRARVTGARSSVRQELRSIDGRAPRRARRGVSSLTAPPAQPGDGQVVRAGRAADRVDERQRADQLRPVASRAAARCRRRTEWPATKTGCSTPSTSSSRPIRWA